MASDKVPVDIAVTLQGWRVCHHQLLKMDTAVVLPIPDFVQFAKSQPAYISQYYKNITCELPYIELYNLIKESTKIIMAIDRGAISLKGSFRFVLITTNGTVLLSSYGQPAGHNPLSFRSEVCAFLAAICKIFLIVEHYNASIGNFVAITS